MYTLQRNPHIFRPDVGGLVNSICPDWRGGCGGHALPIGIVCVYNRTAIGRQFGEQPQLRLKVIFHVRMKIKMILSQVREDGNLEHAAHGAVQRQRMRRHLHNHGVQSSIRHLLQQCLQFQCSRRRVARRYLIVADHVTDRADQSCALPCRFENGLAYIGRRGLAVRAGDADHFKSRSRITIETACHGPQEVSGVGHFNNRQ